MVGINRQIDPEIRLEKQRRGEEALAVLVLGGVGLHALGLLLREDRVEALRERRIVEPDRIVEAARLKHIDGVTGKGGFARNQRRQIPQPGHGQKNHHPQQKKRRSLPLPHPDQPPAHSQAE